MTELHDPCARSAPYRSYFHEWCGVFCGSTFTSVESESRILRITSENNFCTAQIARRGHGVLLLLHMSRQIRRKLNFRPWRHDVQNSDAVVITQPRKGQWLAKPRRHCYAKWGHVGSVPQCERQIPSATREILDNASNFRKFGGTPICSRLPLCFYKGLSEV